MRLPGVQADLFDLCRLVGGRSLRNRSRSAVPCSRAWRSRYFARRARGRQAGGKRAGKERGCGRKGFADRPGADRDERRSRSPRAALSWTTGQARLRVSPRPSRTPGPTGRVGRGALGGRAYRPPGRRRCQCSSASFGSCSRSRASTARRLSQARSAATSSRFPRIPGSTWSPRPRRQPRPSARSPTAPSNALASRRRPRSRSRAAHSCPARRAAGSPNSATNCGRSSFAHSTASPRCVSGRASLPRRLAALRRSSASNRSASAAIAC